MSVATTMIELKVDLMTIKVIKSMSYMKSLQVTNNLCNFISIQSEGIYLFLRL